MVPFHTEKSSQALPCYEDKDYMPLVYGKGFYLCGLRAEISQGIVINI